MTSAWEIRDRHRCQGDALGRAVAGLDQQPVIDEIEDDFERARAIGDGRRGEPARREVERDVPPMIDQRCQCHPHLADDLGPSVQRLASLAPLRQRQVRPRRVCAHASIIR
jgi:hypothetical protein